MSRAQALFPSPPRLAAWWRATRPRTLTVGLVPVGVGTALAASAGKARVGLACLAGLSALLIQVGTNLLNDYYDHRRGADTQERLGPPRACAQGWLSPRQVRWAGFLCLGAAAVAGAGLLASGGWPILAIGLLSLLAGYAYTGGPYPLAYHGLGEPFVFVFFGLLAVGGTFYLQALEVRLLVLAAAVPVGALGTALLTVNNLRDQKTDAAAGKRTLAVICGTRFARGLYFVLLGVAFATPPALWVMESLTAWAWLPWGALPLAVAAGRTVWHGRGEVLNRALALTAALQLVFGALLSVAVLLGSRR